MAYQSLAPVCVQNEWALKDLPWKEDEKYGLQKVTLSFRDSSVLASVNPNPFAPPRPF